MFIIILSILIFGGYYILPTKINPLKNGEIVIHPAKITNYQTVYTKLAANKTYAIYRNVNQNGGVNPITTTKFFKTSLLQSQESAHTKKGTYWLLFCNGRQVGWVNEKFFLRNKISLAKNISLVRNPNYDFNVHDAIAYAVDSQGNLINPSQIKVSQNLVNSANPGNYLVIFKYHKIKAKAIVNVRSEINEGTTVVNKSASFSPTLAKSFSGSSQKTSPNWNYENNYQPETKTSSYYAKPKITMTTRFFQPRFHLLDYTQENSSLNQVGVIPEGISLFNKYLTVSYFNNTNNTRGHLVTYNLNNLTNPIQTQNLLTMSWSEFKKQSQNIMVSPYLTLGHGQALGMDKNYLYVLASNNQEANPAKSEIILQISRQNYQIKNLWTMKVWNRSAYYPRYFHNADLVNSHLIYAVFHNTSKNQYEYWRIIRQKNSWIPTEVTATQSRFVTNNAPLQGFTYSQGNFYLAFNDNIFKVAATSGKVLMHYHFNTLRENEGIAVMNKRIYVELARRPELLQIKTSS